MRPALVVALLVLVGSRMGYAEPSACVLECREEGRANGWSKAARKACKSSCRQEQKRCKELPKDDRGGCVARNKDCTEYCGHTWPEPDQIDDRTACHSVCGSCYRAGTEHCVEKRTDPVDFIARCCGGEGQPSCCPDAALSGLNTCADLESDVRNCGICGRACDESQGQACVGSTCTALPTCPGGCTAGLTCCATNAVGGGKCVSLTSHRENCGQCGKICPDGQACENSMCVVACTAFPGTTACSTDTGGIQCCPTPASLCCPNSRPTCQDNIGDDVAAKCCYYDVGGVFGSWLCRVEDGCCLGAGGFGYREGCCPPGTQCTPNPSIPGLNYCASQ